MELKFNSLDTLFFRDGKPFAMGEETWADGLFPPNPSVVYGAIRTGFACIEGKEIPFSEIKSKLYAQKLSISAIVYSLENASYLPMPLDFAAFKNKTEQERRLEQDQKEYNVDLLSVGEKKVITKKDKNLGLLYQNTFQQVESFSDGLLSISDLKTYLNGTLKTTKVRRFKDYIIAEPKIGIGRDDTKRTADEGKIFRTDMKRLKDLDLQVSLNAPEYEQDWAKNSVVKLGGEGKLIEMSKAARKTSFIVENEVKITSNRFKIYLATPAIFTTKNWQPNLEKFGINATLKTVCIGKTLHIGGYDLIEGPKMMYKAVPAGSVYYYETETAIIEIVQKLQGKSISDVYPEQGFGIAYFGNY